MWFFQFVKQHSKMVIVSNCFGIFGCSCNNQGDGVVKFKWTLCLKEASKRAFLPSWSMYPFIPFSSHWVHKNKKKKKGIKKGGLYSIHFKFKRLFSISFKLKVVVSWRDILNYLFKKENLKRTVSNVQVPLFLLSIFPIKFKKYIFF